MFSAHSRDIAMPYLLLFLDILSLETIYKFKVALFTYKIDNNATNLLMLFKGTLTLTSEIHSYNTIIVSNLNLYRPRIRNNWRAATFACAGSKIWEKNSLYINKTTV